MRDKYQNIHFRQKCKKNTKARYHDVHYCQQKQQIMCERVSKYVVDINMTLQTKLRNAVKH